MRRSLVLLFITFLLLGCSPKYHPVNGVLFQEAKVQNNQVVTNDQFALPLRVWRSGDEPWAILVAVHGFNDYRRAFDLPGAFLADEGVYMYAYDQRGFGETELRGFWPGQDNLQSDLIALVKHLKHTYSGVPIYLLGDSMGGAVVALTSTHAELPEIEGIILNAPAVWGNQTFNIFQRMALWLLAHTTPWMEVTGKGLKITVTDNIPLLKELSKDPLMIRETRIDALYGMVHLMDAALEVAPKIQVPTLLLYGLKDEVIPLNSVCHFAGQLQGENKRMVFYQEGYHFLLRDLGAKQVWQDIVNWMSMDKQLAFSLTHDACSNV